MHHPRRRPQRLARQRDAERIVRIAGGRFDSRQIETCPHLVRKHQRFAVKRFDEPGPHGCGIVHGIGGIGVIPSLARPTNG